MTFLKRIENDIKVMIESIGYELDDFVLALSNRPELGDYQINDAMKLASKYNKNPREIANEILEILKKDSRLTNLSVAGPGFINLSFSDEFLLDFANSLLNDVKTNIEKKEASKIVLDYGGANVAKILHVGHLRSANIGEALRRVALLLGDEVISDVHLGDSGLQSGIVVNEITKRYPDLECLKEGYTGEDFDLAIEADDLSEIYPSAAKKAKEDESFYEEASEIALQIQKNNLKYKRIWEKVVALSLPAIKKTYKTLNAKFDLYKGEQDSFPFVPEVLKHLEKEGLSYESEGAIVVDVAKADDKKELPPAILVKSNGAYLYETTDIATIYDRKKSFNPDEIWYVVDKRQALHFDSVFRVVEKAKLAEDTRLEFFGFGTMNGTDGKPFKTRDGGIMSLDELISLVKKETYSKLSNNLEETEKEEISHKVAIAALKYSDLLPHRLTDYIFDISKFTELEGKTGPYILYSYIRMNSLLNKAETSKYKNLSKISKDSDRKILVNLLQMPRVLNKVYNDKSPNDLAEYIYKLASDFNSFYGEKQILSEEDEKQKEAWISLIKILKDTMQILIDTLAIEIPERM